MPLSREPQLDPSDIKLLRLFVQIVEFGGFSAAQAQLNVSATTISTQMATLESRLGIRLCDRGRVGFRLTDKGKRVYEAAINLEESIGKFRSEMGEMRGKLVGELRLGIADCVVTNPDMRISEAFAAFSGREHAVHVRLQIDESDKIEGQVLDGKLHIGISAFHHHVPSLIYERLFHEKHSIYCGAAHRLFDLPESEFSPAVLGHAEAVISANFTQRAAVPVPLKAAATAGSMEGALMLIRSGKYIGYLPDHYARQWVELGEIRRLPCKGSEYLSLFEIACRKETAERRLTSVFLQDLRRSFGLTPPVGLRAERLG